MCNGNWSGDPEGPELYCLHDQKELLLELRNNLTYDSSLSTKLVHWNESTDCCQWLGVKCDSKSRVSTLDLSSESISGGINEALFRLVFLRSLNLAQNSFNSVVQFLSGFGNLTYLSYLNLSNSGFSGQISFDLSNLTRLVVLDLSSPYSPSLSIENSDIGRLIHSFTSLRELYLNGVNISAKGYDYDWCNAISSSLPNLRVLSLSNSHLTGPLDSSLLKLQFLSIIRLDGNAFFPRFPEFFADFPNLKFNGSVPSFALLKNLTVINLSRNRLSGQIPFPPSSASSYVDFSNNNFSSSLPPDTGNFLRRAFFFSVANNSLIGTIPLSLCNARHLQVLDLSNNRLHGRIPYCLLQTSLTVLNLKRNNLSGHIPNTFPFGCGLEILDLSWNVLQEGVPRSLGRCTELAVLDLGNNELRGNLPCWLNNLTKLHVLVLRSNKFHGDISCLGENSSSLQIIDLSSNNFNGVLPANLFQNLMGMVYYQDSVTVNLHGQDVEIVPATSFNSLDFSNNHFQGAIPETVELKYLYVLNFSHNALSGSIPASLGNLECLQTLDLSFNNLVSEIPRQLERLLSLSNLNLSHNKLVGRIPIGNYMMQRFPAGSFIGNEGLCGYPLDSCSELNTPAIQKSVDVGMYISSAWGFFVGLALIIWPLVLSERWRRYYNKNLDNFISLVGEH
ncbi:hypothetical protein BUALT_Bualt09G0123900 [Buddleja alternifolia]|uniref:Leucine-rich repeat-containing N-terminal plant-type domain-containing protein n=1 Tax=Buddleja alternifolia TaxID=168488 RepID=A0AAV6XAL2_9LAMI|nr:hypothetical protein BUALT_Bualt09G0123900 [Buddleja alternifolia]